MPSNATAKTKSARNKLAVAIVLAAVLVLSVGLLWLLARGGDTRMLQAGDYRYQLEVADTPAAREQGLSGRGTLAADAGMLFAYDREGVLCFWMKDMQFPLDIIWLDAARTVVHLEENLSPGTYPENFCSPSPVQYVIELNGGQAARADIEIGQRLEF
jgi:hypothetical protein